MLKKQHTPEYWSSIAAPVIVNKLRRLSPSLSRSNAHTHNDTVLPTRNALFTIVTC